MLKNKTHVSSSLPASLWAATASPAPDYGHVTSAEDCDVAIIGAGFTGLSAALHLARLGRKVIVLEANEPGWGASGRNGGQVITGLKHNPDDLIATFGEIMGGRIIKAMGGAADLVFSLIDRYRIDCHANRSGWIQAAHGPKAYDKLVVPRCRQWHARGIDARLLDRAETARMIGSAPEAYYGGWFDPRGGTLQPLSYARGLASAAIAEGVKVCALSKVEALERDGDHWNVKLARGNVRARQVVMATNAYTGPLWGNLERTIIPVSSFQIATRPLDAAIRARILPGGQGVADTRRLLLYFRLDHQGRFVMGGRSPVDDNPARSDAAPLQAAIARIFPGLDASEIDYVWSGKVAITKDSLPHLHMLALGLIAALGCNGRGVAMCTMMGKIIADLASGTTPADLAFPVTAPNPFALHEFRKIGVFAMSQYYRLLDRLESRSA